jgi:MFS transporter, OPA family, glycerol-3-phosphate transporter
MALGSGSVMSSSAPPSNGPHNEQPVGVVDDESAATEAIDLKYAPAGAGADPPGFRLRRFRNWFFLGLLYAAYYLCRYNLGIVAPELKQDLNLNNAQYGHIQTARDGGYAIGQFVNGLFADALGGKQSMAVGALGTIILNVVFGLTSLNGPVLWILVALILIRAVDGYMQSFGAPGMVKINTAWFRRRERGLFAGIFGGMIQLGAIGVGQLGGLLLLGFSIPLIGLTMGKQSWRMLFFVPPVILLIIVVLMWLNVKNHPEQAGYRIQHDDEAATDVPGERLPLSYVFLKIVSNPFAWVNAGAYFCTGFVRRAIEAWWVVYLLQTWKADKSSWWYLILVWVLPISAFVGSFSSGLISDKLFKGRRSPVAAWLYSIQTVCVLASICVLGYTRFGSPLIACIAMTIVSLACNSTHSIIGTAVAMDIGGRKMAGFASGVIDSFQYFGAMLAGGVLGAYFDRGGWSPQSLFIPMVPFSVLGAILMLGVWLKTRGRDVRGS